ncbi:DUF7344 domain-containing protein [Haloarchaeobius sp. HRN-SO-5]|uniref:DUF7344 domain-containing protein n=1 Tax=Haloarchaeobius sp. HRN-SO-5 TaxID=3446118 RepID=UPI003EB8E8A9
MRLSAEQSGGKHSDGAVGARATTDLEGAGGDGPDSVSKDVLFQTLSNGRRRFVLQALLQSDSMTVRKLTAFVAARECDVPVAELEYRQRKRVYTSLVQTHLPTMHKNGLVDYDKSRGTVEATLTLDTFWPYLDGGDATSPRPSPWSTRYLGLAAVFGALLTGSWLGIVPFQFVPPVVYGAVLVGTLAATAGLHRQWERRPGGGDRRAVGPLETESE